MSADNGKTWVEADLEEGLDQPYGRAWAWTTWSAEVPVGDGPVELVARAHDLGGGAMPRTPADVWNIRGLNNAVGRSSQGSERSCPLTVCDRLITLLSHLPSRRWRSSTSSARCVARRRRQRGRRRERVDDVFAVARRDAPPLELTHAAVEVARPLVVVLEAFPSFVEDFGGLRHMNHRTHGNAPHLAESRTEEYCGAGAAPLSGTVAANERGL